LAPSVSATRLWFCRHGEVEEPWVGTFIGTTDVGLSPLGRHQAEAIAAYLQPAPLDAVVCSPRKRSLDTIAPLARGKGHKLDVRKDLAEMHFGSWEGKTWEQILELDADHAKQWEHDPTNTAPPGGESANQFADRVRRGLEEVVTEYKGRSVVIGAHAGTNRGIMAAILGRPYMEMFSFAQDYGCVNAVGWMADGGFGQLALLNFVPGPPSQRHGARKEEK
jgi:broad specificity phosphatase PhoE